VDSIDADGSVNEITVCLPQKNAATRLAAAAAKITQNTIRPVRRRVADGLADAAVSVIPPI
jgi:hypothetical protein